MCGYVVQCCDASRTGVDVFDGDAAEEPARRRPCVVVPQLDLGEGAERLG